MTLDFSQKSLLRVGEISIEMMATINWPVDGAASATGSLPLLPIIGRLAFYGASSYDFSSSFLIASQSVQQLFPLECNQSIIIVLLPDAVCSFPTDADSIL